MNADNGNGDDQVPKWTFAFRVMEIVLLLALLADWAMTTLSELLGSSSSAMTLPKPVKHRLLARKSHFFWNWNVIERFLLHGVCQHAEPVGEGYYPTATWAEGSQPCFVVNKKRSAMIEKQKHNHNLSSAAEPLLPATSSSSSYAEEQCCATRTTSQTSSIPVVHLRNHMSQVNIQSNHVLKYPNKNLSCKLPIPCKLPILELSPGRKKRVGRMDGCFFVSHVHAFQ
jgi:hypothetical protein